MKKSIGLVKTFFCLSRVLGFTFLIFYLNGCDLEVIPPIAQTPKSNFTFAIMSPGCASNCNVTFTNTSTNADTYEWNFDDGTPISTLANPVHIFSSIGSYDVNLKAVRAGVAHDTTITVVLSASEGTGGTGSASGSTTLSVFKHTANASNISAQLTALDNAHTNNLPDRIIVISPVLGLRNLSALGVYYFGNKWRIFNENVSNIQENEIFHVVVASPTNTNAFVHQTSAATIRAGYISTIDHVATNNKPNARVFVTPVWEKSSDYNNHPVGVVYVNNRWEIVNLDQVNLPIGLKFNVIVSEDDTQSFIHTTTASSVTLDYTIIDNAKTNGKPNLKTISTPNLGTNAVVIPNARVNGLWYIPSSGKWTVFNENSVDMPQNVSYNILAIE